MNILGFAGLHHSVDVKRAMFPALGARECRFTQGLESAAALITDGVVRAAAAEERFSLQKGTERFPQHAMQFCLERAGITAADVDYVAHGFAYEDQRHRYVADPRLAALFDSVYSTQTQLSLLTRFLGAGDWASRFVPVRHHLAHAASTFYMSGFEEALVLIADGMGEDVSVTVATADATGIHVLAEASEFQSLGILYGLFTHYLGFDFSLDEYKVMGLAPYGNPRRFMAQMEALVAIGADGLPRIPILTMNHSFDARATYRGTFEEIERRFGPSRTPGACIEDRHKDIAAALQRVLQTTLLDLLRVFRRRTGARNLCMAGGVALNCSANGAILRSRLFQRMFVQPAASDDGTALGAALMAARMKSPGVRFDASEQPFWGPEYSDETIARALPASGLGVRRFDAFETLAADVAARVEAGQVVGWFQGRMEYGPRALGSRSIIADPRDPTMKDRINALVKQREDFRPFAPAVAEEAATRYFCIEPGDEDTFANMLIVTTVRPEYQATFPATTHCDHSARVQVVARRRNARFWSLLQHVGARTGHPLVLNTSFNVRGQPIVCSPREAVSTFHTARLDALAIGNYVLAQA